MAGEQTNDTRGGGSYVVDDLIVDIGQRRVVRNAAEISLSKLSFECLRVLIEAAPDAVSHDALTDAVWGARRVVTPENLSKRILLLRRSLGDSAERPRYIEGIRGHGYRLIPQVVYREARAASREPARPRLSRQRAAAAGLVGAAALLGLYLVSRGIETGVVDLPSAAPATPTVRFELESSAQARYVPAGFIRDVAASPDGRLIAYRGGSDSLIIRRLDALDTIEIAGTGGPASFSPDSRRIAYAGPGVIEIVSLDDLGSRRTAGLHENPNAGDLRWTGDNEILLADRTGLRSLSVDSGELTMLAHPDRTRGELGFSTPSYLPDRSGILLTALPNSRDTPPSVRLLDLRSGGSSTLIDAAMHPTYVDTGHLLYVSGTELRAVAFDPDERRVDGESIVLVGNLATSGIAGNYGVSDADTLVYAVGQQSSDRQLIWISRDGRSESLGAPALPVSFPRISPDGRYVALDLRGVESDIWVWDIERRTLVRLTNDPADNVMPVWHPNSDRLAFGDARHGVAQVFMQMADGQRRPERLISGETREMPADMTPDGRQILYHSLISGIGWNTLAYDPRTRTSTPVLVGDVNYMNSDLSPDGRWIAYQSMESGEFEVYVRPYPDTAAGRWKISTAGGAQPRWSADGRELYFVDPANELMAVTVGSGPVFDAGMPERLFDFDRFHSVAYDAGGTFYDVSPDGRFLSYREWDDARELSHVRLIVSVNWKRELLRRLPASGR